ncbi:MAG: TlpA disulfide reductase family protein [Bacteroidota bacterium]
MKFLYVTIVLHLLFITRSFAQNQNAYASSDEPRQTQSQYEGMPPMPFQAFDMKGKTHTLADYKGKVVVLAFWAAGDETSRNQIKSWNRLKKEFDAEEVAIISLANENKSDLTSFLKNHQLEYPVIPNARPLGELGYGSDLGMSRVFILDQTGVIKKVMVFDTEEEMNTYKTLRPIIQKMIE